MEIALFASIVSIIGLCFAFLYCDSTVPMTKSDGSASGGYTDCDVSGFCGGS